MIPLTHSATGPGPIAPDGSPVELYKLLTPRGEQAVIHDAVPPGATILELGCGAGRLTRALAALGHEIVAVDECPDMLRNVPDEHAGVRIRKICAMIQELRLDEEFDAVLLASNLITSFPAWRRQFLDTCRRHVSAAGSVLIEKHDPALFAAPLRRERGDRTFVVRDIVREDRFVRATLETHVGETAWTQRITVENLSHSELLRCLRESSLEFDTYLTEDRTWLRAGRAAPEPRAVAEG
jgi:SAM-dependent methyltransferase